MIHFNQIRNASLDQLTSELAAAGRDSTQSDIYAARDAVARLANETQWLALYDSETNEAIREATNDEAAESIAASDEGHIDVEDRRCYVA